MNLCDLVDRHLFFDGELRRRGQHGRRENTRVGPHPARACARARLHARTPRTRNLAPLQRITPSLLALHRCMRPTLAPTSNHSVGAMKNQSYAMGLFLLGPIN